MPINKPTSPIKASTQSFVEIEDIKDDIIVLRDSFAATVLEVGAVNFWLLSQEEQNSMIVAYGNLLNSLSFPVQILILSKKMDISLYLDYLANKVSQQQENIIKKRLMSYQEFVKNIVKKTSVLEKRFFFVIPFSPLELGVTAVNAKNLNKTYIVARAKTALYPKRDNLVRLLGNIGLKAKPLQEQALTELFYNLYNPSATGRQLAPVKSYTDIILTT
ncbi:hypothetical protein A3G67_00535 [Candidatus Roizmanbacteria bacterium RIFCSPLOWO2_12_FULL_40_12]|uniref:Uncharacterized protein n=1 Tax=Candidatus Roizmanbacteria bacterium RIFCSPLOWO2_01_FULL_40_42 TaxID=1802066 RepID=A0A1F7J670_9BACT|nr:MAG: hypothetical protein A2779_02015 [Candidatus Roizmanbacteria bacterium RIFCSPHIGHO2_01_FULL_40_98]OGK28769.1 MAG: hypothetical protein A3C31_03935 [Candidatus Roizmanbacteria bacterium RIFCSPHIGHO2_02_FULL_40_53]OGK29627.1 MAG: hypothetical protein A2W49_00330 [Candidatus Roizmanbacteria bacterium RIFCSPHIGHO2_12_41_18]OGK36338.1 MAG: hypothetical protein A3E69_02850 [Candidatus Roizmanbacteria bacterium RIFCSPHIGHO2_12_FULL_40_130]OGK51110.1 MAG: hypothetical protein A3B50_04910 [Candi